jgi:hypothetical protein
MTPGQKATAERDAKSAAAVHGLIAERGLGRFATFYEVGEGDFHPDGTESTSGYVVTEDGREFYFWMEWDAQAGRTVLGTWEEVTGEATDSVSGEYAEALAAVGRSEPGRNRARAAG